MSDEPERSVEPLNNEDLWVRGQAYANHKHLLEEAEAQIPYLERAAARARYEYEITQRIQDKQTDPEAHQDWEIRASVAHDMMIMAEHRLAETLEDAAYHRAMVAEMEADLGDKAQAYGEILADLYWEEEWDEEDFDEFEEPYEARFDPSAPIPFPDDENGWENDQLEVYR